MQWLSGFAAGARGVRGGGAIECGRAESGSRSAAFRHRSRGGRKTSPYLASASSRPRPKLYYLTSWGVDKLEVSYNLVGQPDPLQLPRQRPETRQGARRQEGDAYLLGRRAGHCCRFR